MNEKLKPCPFEEKAMEFVEWFNNNAIKITSRSETITGRQIVEELGNFVVAFRDMTWNTRQSPPPWETPEQYKERTGEEYPDDGPVWSSEGPFDWEKMEGHFWNLVEYRDIKLNKSNGFHVVIATPEHGKPKPEYRPNKYKDGEPCGHPGCLAHTSHPCERCGRINGKGKPKPDWRPE